MRILKNIKAILNSKQLEWLIDHQKDIENMIESKRNKPGMISDKSFSVAGVPDFQKDYVNRFLDETKK